MPITKSAKKALRQNNRHKALNSERKLALREVLKLYKKALTSDVKSAQGQLAGVYQKLDKAAKVNLITKNKASRLKSRLTKRLAVVTK